MKPEKLPPWLVARLYNKVTSMSGAGVSVSLEPKHKMWRRKFTAHSIYWLARSFPSDEPDEPYLRAPNPMSVICISDKKIRARLVIELPPFRPDRDEFPKP